MDTSGADTKDKGEGEDICCVHNGSNDDENVTSNDAPHGAGSAKYVSRWEGSETGPSYGGSSESGVSLTDFSLMCLQGNKSIDEQIHEGVQEGILPSVSVSSDVYDTSHKRRGYALLINQEQFSIKLQRQGYMKRTGTAVDERSIQRTLQALEFELTSVYDLSANSIRSFCSKMAAKDHTDADCFVCVILSHGEEGVIYGTDKAVEIKELANFFKGDKCPSLIGKPKLFFIQACRGLQTDAGVAMNVTDARPMPSKDPQMIKLPVEADFLFAYSTVPGYYSWRNGMNGSWFIQALCSALQKYGSKMELLKLLTLVNRTVALDFKSNNPENIDLHEMKQIPCIASMLTKDVYFPQKKAKKRF